MRCIELVAFSLKKHDHIIPIKKEIYFKKLKI